MPFAISIGPTLLAVIACCFIVENPVSFLQGNAISIIISGSIFNLSVITLELAPHIFPDYSKSKRKQRLVRGVTLILFTVLAFLGSYIF